MCDTKIVNILKEIVKKRFPNEPAIKKQVLVYNNRISFACPFCGDSKNPSKKRGNIYTDTNYFKCYNGDCHMSFMPLSSFLRHFNQLGKFSFDELEELQPATLQKTITANVNHNSLMKVGIPRKLLKEKLYLKEFDEGRIDLLRYVINRKLDLFREKLLFNNHLKQIYILNTDKTGQRIFGLQIRNMTGDIKYITWPWSKILEKMKMADQIKYDKSIIDIIDNESLKFGLIDLDYSKPIYVTEGPIDSFFLNNSISLCGIKKMNQLEYLPNTHFIFDNDETGLKYGIKFVNKHKVFSWSKFLKDYPLKNVKDINDVVIQMDISNIDMEKYFVTDSLDLFNINNLL